MKILAWIFGVLIGIPALYIGSLLVYPVLTVQDHRFRLTLTVKTPDGPRIASSVIRVERRYGAPWEPNLSSTSYSDRVIGDAVFVNLGQGKNAFMLLAHGPKAEGSDMMRFIWVGAYLGTSQWWNEDIWRSGKSLEGKVELKPPLIPTIVTFTDIDDPASAKVVYATGYDGIRTAESYSGSGIVLTNDFARIFGPGYALGSVTLEMVPSGKWPQFLYGDSGELVTHGIEAKLPWWGKRSGMSYNDMRGADGQPLSPEHRQTLIYIFQGMKRNL